MYIIYDDMNLFFSRLIAKVTASLASHDWTFIDSAHIKPALESWLLNVRYEQLQKNSHLACSAQSLS